VSDSFVTKYSEWIFFAEQVEGFVTINFDKQWLGIDFFDIFLDDSLLLEDLHDLFFIKIFQIFFTVNFV
jgi:hypothetical protein